MPSAYFVRRILNWLIIDVYMPSAGTADRDLLCTDLLNELDILIGDYRDYNCLIGGEFNID